MTARSTPVDASLEPTVAHYHSTDSECLRQIERIPTGQYLEGKPVEVDAAHWWRCTFLVIPLRPPQCGAPYDIHEHAGRFFAHEPRDRCGFAA